jgi:hypothetical protein
MTQKALSLLRLRSRINLQVASVSATLVALRSKLLHSWLYLFPLVFILKVTGASPLHFTTDEEISQQPTNCEATLSAELQELLRLKRPNTM